MPEKYSISVRIGDAEFTAEGPEETVKEAYGLFLKAIRQGAVEQARAPKPPEQRENNDGGLSREILEQAFKVDKESQVVSLRILPNGDGRQQKADAAILLIYGFQEMLDLAHAPVMKLNEGIRQSGITMNRLDRFIDVHSGLYMKGGTRSGGRYTLTNKGKRWVEDQLRSMFG